MNERGAQSDDFSFGKTLVVPRRRELRRGGSKVEIGDRAFELLMVLVAARDTVVSKNRIMDLVWDGRIVEENTLEVQISTLRRALGEDRSAIRTVVGRGYQFVGELWERPGADGAASVAVPLSSAGVRLPATVSRIIGRRKEVGEVTAFASDHRLVTLVGSGGVGKTRLALEVAHHLSSSFADGVYLAELAATASASFLPAAIATALGFPPGDGTPSLDRMAATLSPRHMLLVLDNCEHLVESVARIAEALLNVAPSATILRHEPGTAADRGRVRLPCAVAECSSGGEPMRTAGFRRGAAASGPFGQR